MACDNPECHCENCICDSCECTIDNPCGCDEEPEMWEHFCPREGYDMYIGKGEPCNWCGIYDV
ncbi:MAG: hypothetical protein QGH83_09365 [Candidatus Pacebacteria bacterium]|jgi:hypothetical protein|nr:hypothetical protein [Candidatus Paceibacterota bacterium]